MFSLKVILVISRCSSRLPIASPSNYLGLIKSQWNICICLAGGNEISSEMLCTYAIYMLHIITISKGGIRLSCEFKKINYKSYRTILNHFLFSEEFVNLIKSRGPLTLPPYFYIKSQAHFCKENIFSTTIFYLPSFDLSSIFASQIQSKLSGSFVHK